MAIHPGFPNGCTWLVEVRSGHPEPDFPSDMWVTVECGAPVHTVDGYPDGFRCDAGHEDLGYEAESKIGAIEDMAGRFFDRDLEPDEIAQLRLRRK